MWTYHSDTGKLEHNGWAAGFGYSGNGQGLNNPALESVPEVGPIPRGKWTMSRFFSDPVKGPIVCHLIPAASTDTFGRSGFMIHGDNSKETHSGSHGCVILSCSQRAMIRMSGDILWIVA